MDGRFVFKEACKIKLALSIFSGRIPVEHLAREDYELLGYDAKQILPDKDDILYQLEQLVFDALDEKVDPYEKENLD